MVAATLAVIALVAAFWSNRKKLYTLCCSDSRNHAKVVPTEATQRGAVRLQRRDTAAVAEDVTERAADLLRLSQGDIRGAMESMVVDAIEDEVGKENQSKVLQRTKMLAGLWGEVGAEKFKILTTYWQIQSIFTSKDSMPTEYPPSYVQTIDTIGSAANIDLWSLFTFDCFATSTYIEVLLFKMLVPTTILVATAGAVALLYRLDKLPMLRRGLANFFCIAVFLVFVSVSKSAFSLFNCRHGWAVGRVGKLVWVS